MFGARIISVMKRKKTSLGGQMEMLHECFFKVGEAVTSYYYFLNM